MSATRSDALVFFGATGDLAYKKIFPALAAMVRRGHLDVPVVGVARSMSCSLFHPDFATPMTGKSRASRLAMDCSAGKIFL